MIYKFSVATKEVLYYEPSNGRLDHRNNPIGRWRPVGFDKETVIRHRAKKWHSTEIRSHSRGPQDYRFAPFECSYLPDTILDMMDEKFDTDFVLMRDNQVTYVEDPDIIMYLKLGGNFRSYIKSHKRD